MPPRLIEHYQSPHPPGALPDQRSTLSFTNLAQSRSADVEDLLKLYPNSFDQLGSLKGEYDIKVDQTVPPVQHARRKVPIEKQGSNRRGH